MPIHHRTGGKEVKTFRRITLDMVLASTSLTRSSKETNEVFLQRVTHLHLQAKKIKTIEGIDQCTNLKVLYLYDNQISKIQNLDFAGILQYLYLHNNLIKEIPHLMMPNLKKIFLDDNEISEVTGLTECVNLEELHIARQRLPTFTSLQFESSALFAISRTLQVLEISGSNISILQPFSVLYNLRKLFCKDNSVVDLNEVETIVSLPRLEEANFLGNPCCKLFKYRDVTIGAAAECFVLLDEVPIPRHQQVAIRGLMDHRRKIGAMSRFDPAQSQSQEEGSYGQQVDDGGGEEEVHYQDDGHNYGDEGGEYHN